MAGGQQSVALQRGMTVPPPGWARWTDRLRARIFSRSIDEKLLNGRVADADPVVIVRRARLISGRYRSTVASSLRQLVAAGRHPGLNRFRAQIQLRTNTLIECSPLILELAAELESEESVSPRGVIMAERLITDGDSPVYAPIAVSKPLNETLDSAVRHARAALHLG
jgi:hypothetical protein